MEVVEFVELFPVIDLPDVCDLSGVIEWDFIGFGLDVDSVLPLGFDHFMFLVGPCGVECEGGVFDFEGARAAGFEDASFAEQKCELSFGEEVADNRPFFKCDIEIHA